jgi:ribonuclease D
MFIGFKLAKEFQYNDWEVENLSEEMIAYAGDLS